MNHGSATSTATAGTRIGAILEATSESVGLPVGADPFELDDVLDEDEDELEDDVPVAGTIETPPVAAPTVVVRQPGFAPTPFETLLQIKVFCVKFLLVPSSNS